MNAPSISCLCLLSLLFVSCDDPDWGDSPADGSKRALLLERMDANKDGVISPEEREAAKRKRASRTAMNANVERPKLNQTQRNRITKRFDADGDGELSDEERAAVRKAMQKKRAAQAQ